MIEVKPGKDQGRAPGLYDEQLQRQQQEKALFGRRGTARPSHAPSFFFPAGDKPA